MSNEQIFSELLIGNNKYIHLANMCIVKDRICAIVVEENGYPAVKVEEPAIGLGIMEEWRTDGNQ
jgi:hypothetical protein